MRLNPLYDVCPHHIRANSMLPTAALLDEIPSIDRALLERYEV